MCPSCADTILSLNISLMGSENHFGNNYEIARGLFACDRPCRAVPNERRRNFSPTLRILTPRGVLPNQSFLISAEPRCFCVQQAEPNKFHDDKSLYTGTHVQGGPTSTDNVITLSNLADRSSADVRGLPKRLSGKTACGFEKKSQYPTPMG
jgi:hypothetical protein